MKRYFTTAIILFTASLTLHATTYTAYQVPAGTIGNQILPPSQTQSLGMDFDVNSPIQVTSLGVFDSGGDGLLGTLHARIYDRDTRESLVDLVFSATNPGTLIDGSRFRDLSTPLVLSAGFHGVISVAYLGNQLEPNGNCRVSPGNWTMDSGGGLISFVGLGRHSWMGTGDAFPDIVETNADPYYATVNNFAAGTFMFSAVPEPSTILLLLAGGAVFSGRCIRSRVYPRRAPTS